MTYLPKTDWLNCSISFHVKGPLRDFGSTCTFSSAVSALQLGSHCLLGAGHAHRSLRAFNGCQLHYHPNAGEHNCMYRQRVPGLSTENHCLRFRTGCIHLSQHLHLSPSFLHLHHGWKRHHFDFKGRAKEHQKRGKDGFNVWIIHASDLPIPVQK